MDTFIKTWKAHYIPGINLAEGELMKALGISTQNQFSKFVSLQAYHTVAARDLERKIFPLLLDQKLELLVWKPLAGTVHKKIVKTRTELPLNLQHYEKFVLPEKVDNGSTTAGNIFKENGHTAIESAWNTGLGIMISLLLKEWN